MCREGKGQRLDHRLKLEQLPGLAGQREWRGGAWALRKFVRKVELSEEPGGGWGRREGRTRFPCSSPSGLRVWESETEAGASGGTP